MRPYLIAAVALSLALAANAQQATPTAPQLSGALQVCRQQRNEQADRVIDYVTSLNTAQQRIAELEAQLAKLQPKKD